MPGQRARSTFTTSRTAAPTGEVTTPTVRG